MQYDNSFFKLSDVESKEIDKRFYTTLACRLKELLSSNLDFKQFRLIAPIITKFWQENNGDALYHLYFLAKKFKKAKILSSATLDYLQSQYTYRTNDSENTIQSFFTKGLDFIRKINFELGIDYSHIQYNYYYSDKLKLIEKIRPKEIKSNAMRSILIGCLFKNDSWDVNVNLYPDLQIDKTQSQLFYFLTHPDFASQRRYYCLTITKISKEMCKQGESNLEYRNFIDKLFNLSKQEFSCLPFIRYFKFNDRYDESKYINLFHPTILALYSKLNNDFALTIKDHQNHENFSKFLILAVCNKKIDFKFNLFISNLERYLKEKERSNDKPLFAEVWSILINTIYLSRLVNKEPAHQALNYEFSTKYELKDIYYPLSADLLTEIARWKNSKENLLDFIDKLPLKDSIEFLKLINTKGNPLHDFFKVKRGVFEPKNKNGVLKKASEILNKKIEEQQQELIQDEKIKDEIKRNINESIQVLKLKKCQALTSMLELIWTRLTPVVSNDNNIDDFNIVEFSHEQLKNYHSFILNLGEVYKEIVKLEEYKPTLTESIFSFILKEFSSNPININDFTWIDDLSRLLKTFVIKSSTADVNNNNNDFDEMLDLSANADWIEICSVAKKLDFKLTTKEFKLLLTEAKFISNFGTAENIRQYFNDHIKENNFDQTNISKNYFRLFAKNERINRDASTNTILTVNNNNNYMKL